MKKPLLLPFAATLLMIAAMRIQGMPLQTPDTPFGILHLEFVWRDVRYDKLMDFWPRWTVIGNLLLDFLFIGAYTWFLCTASRRLGARYESPEVVPSLVNLALAAGALDVVENACLLTRIFNREGEGLLKVAAVAAGLKFFLIGYVALFLVGTLLFKRRRKEPGPVL